jgi:hypothetical protein
MKAINVPTTQIFEFECDLDLLERAFADFKTQSTTWVDNPEMQPNITTLIGYVDHKNRVPWYHEELFDWMQSCLDQVSAHTVKVPLAICDSWTTKTEFKQRSVKHIHSFSVFSGLLYFTEHKASTTIFEYNDHNRERFGKFFTEFTNGKLEFKPEKGKFLIFPSDIYHYVQVHTDLKATRYSLSFNTFFDGSISSSNTSMLENKVITVKDRYLKWKAEQGQ